MINWFNPDDKKYLLEVFVGEGLAVVRVALSTLPDLLLDLFKPVFLFRISRAQELRILRRFERRDKARKETDREAKNHQQHDGRSEDQNHQHQKTDSSVHPPRNVAKDRQNEQKPECDR